MREIVLDTETTGLDSGSGSDPDSEPDRIVEIGCVELVNHMPTGETWQQYINPERDMPDEAFRVHGLSETFLGDFPVFDRIADDFLSFIGDARLVIHNADFDLGFINAELNRAGRETMDPGRVTDTLDMARQKFPGAGASLDALCRRFEIDNTDRTLHGALLDARLLSEVYLELAGGREPGLVLKSDPSEQLADGATKPRREPRPHQPGAEEIAAHKAFVDTLSDPVWRIS